MRVPTVAWWPGTIPAGSETAEIAATIDMLPTFAALAGAELPTDRIIDGYDISSLLLDPAAFVANPKPLLESTDGVPALTEYMGLPDLTVEQWVKPVAQKSKPRK